MAGTVYSKSTKIENNDCTVLQEYLKKVVYKYQDEIVQFDGNGDPPGRYDIVNFQEIQTLECKNTARYILFVFTVAV